MKLGDFTHKIRSKNAGPFWVSIDVFCEDEAAFRTLCARLKTESIAAALQVPPERIKRFEIANLKVLKFSFPRSVPQGSRLDRDMHGAQFSHLLTGLEIPD